MEKKKIVYEAPEIKMFPIRIEKNILSPTTVGGAGADDVDYGEW